MREVALDVIGPVCDHGGCVASPRVRIVLAAGQLELCQHHWQWARDTLVGRPSFQRAVTRDGATIAVHVRVPDVAAASMV